MTIFQVQFEYPDDVTIFCLDRQINGCTNHVDDEFIGTKGRAMFNYRRTGLKTRDGNSWRFRGDRNNPYQVEHDELIQSIRLGEPINEAKQVAESTMTAILGRERCTVVWSWNGMRYSMQIRTTHYLIMVSVIFL